MTKTKTNEKSTTPTKKNATIDRIEALDTSTTYTYVPPPGQTYVPIRIIEKYVPLPGLVSPYGVRVERTDTNTQHDVHVKDITRAWAETISLEFDLDQLREELLGRSRSHYRNMTARRGSTIPKKVEVILAELGLTHSVHTHSWIEVGDKPLFVSERTYKSVITPNDGWMATKEELSSAKVVDFDTGKERKARKAEVEAIEFGMKPPLDIDALWTALWAAEGVDFEKDVVDKAIAAIQDGGVSLEARISSDSYLLDRFVRNLIGSVAGGVTPC